MNEEDRKRLAQRLADVQKNLAKWSGSSEPEEEDESTDWSTIPLRGFRKFLVRDGSLTGVTYQWRIAPGVNDSVCGRGITYARVRTAQNNRVDINSGEAWDLTKMMPPSPDHTMERCSCGFHAVYTRDNFDDFWGFAEGMMEGWGEVVTGPLGFRASKCRVAALCFNTNVPPNGHMAYGYRTRDELESQIERVKDTYDVPVFNSRAELLAAFPPERGEFPVEAQRGRHPYGGRGGGGVRISWGGTPGPWTPGIQNPIQPPSNPAPNVMGCPCVDCKRARGEL